MHLVHFLGRYQKYAEKYSRLKGTCFITPFKCMTITLAKQWHYLILRIGHKGMQFCLA
jgi:hypothetical protein